MLFSPAGKRLFKFAVIIAALWILFYAGLLVWGQYQWRQVQAELAAKGESLNIADLAPPKVPDAENFFAAPFWQEDQASENASTQNYFSQLKEALGGNKGNALIDASPTISQYTQPFDLQFLAKTYRNIKKEQNHAEADPRYILSQLESANTPLNALSEAVKRPSARFLDDYEIAPMLHPASSGLFPWAYFRLITKSLGLRSIAASAAGDGDASFKDILTLIALIDHFEKEPLWELQLTRRNLITTLTRSIWNGIYYGSWSDVQIETIEKALREIPLIEPITRSSRGERARNVLWTKPYIRYGGVRAWFRDQTPDSFGAGEFLTLFLIPRASILDGLADQSLAIQKIVDALQSAHPEKISASEDDYETKHYLSFLISPVKAALKNTTAILANQAKIAFGTEANVRQASIACALELYRREHHTYPNSLTDIPNLALDPITSQPFRYQRMPSSGYALWSPGLDGKDDGGKLSAPKESGDIVWSMPAERPAFAIPQ